jgi:hypothetical protein
VSEADASPQAEAVRLADAFLTTGIVTQDNLILLGHCVWWAARRYNFRPPDGGDWNGRAVEETVQEFCATRKPVERLTFMANQSIGPGDFLRQLRAAVANHIRGALRTTERGQLAIVLTDVLKQGPQFANTPDGRYGQRSHMTQPDRPVNELELLAVAWEIRDLKPARWRADSKTAPFAHRDDLKRLCIGILEAARCALSLRPS